MPTFFSSVGAGPPEVTLADLGAIGVVDRVAMAGDSPLGHDEAGQLAFHAGRFLGAERVAADEVGAVELHHPAEPGFERRGRLVEIVAVERELAFEAKRVSRAEADRLAAGRGRRLDESVPQRLCIAAGAKNLEPVLGGVAGAGDADRPVRYPRVGDEAEARQRVREAPASAAPARVRRPDPEKR